MSEGSNPLSIIIFPRLKSSLYFPLRVSLILIVLLHLLSLSFKGIPVYIRYYSACRRTIFSFIHKDCITACFKEVIGKSSYNSVTSPSYFISCLVSVSDSCSKKSKCLIIGFSHCIDIPIKEINIFPSSF